MKVSVKGYITHKAAERFVDCFDRYGHNLSNHKFAISDGVSKSFFPDVWAEILVENFVSTKERIDLGDFHSYRELQNNWIKKVGEIVMRPEQKYFVKNFFIEGRSAAATFVGLHFFKEDNILKWEAIALGDSFLFFVPNALDQNEPNYNILSLSSKEDLTFNNFPDFFDSRNIHNKGKIRQKKNDLRSGTFYLMTDALSEWFLSNSMTAMETINSWQSQKDFEICINELRKINLANDDSSILKIDVLDDKIDDIHYDDVEISNFSQLLNDEKQQEILNQHIPEYLEPVKIIENPVDIQISNTTLPQSTFKSEGTKKKNSEKRKRTNEEENDDLISLTEEDNSKEINHNDINIDSKSSAEVSVLRVFIRWVFSPNSLRKNPFEVNKKNLPSDDDVRSTTDKF